MHYFTRRRLLVAFPRLDPTEAPFLDPTGDFRLQTPNLPTSEKNPAGAHEQSCGAPAEIESGALFFQILCRIWKHVSSAKHRIAGKTVIWIIWIFYSLTADECSTSSYLKDTNCSFHYA